MMGGPGELRKVAHSGGPPIRVSSYSGTPRGAVWGPDDTIVYATNDVTTGLLSVPASGGESKVLTKANPTQGEQDHWMPSLSPDGRIVFFTISSPNGPENGQIAALDMETGAHKPIVRGGTDAVYVDASASGEGYLVYGFSGELRAVRFDRSRMTAIGEPVPVVEQVAMMPTGATDFSVSGDGTLVYVPGSLSTVLARPLVWVSRNGREEPVNAPPRAYTLARLSPDETRIALAASAQEQDVWIYELRRGTMTRLTFDPNTDSQPLWSPDGRRLVFASTRTGTANLYSQAADGTGAVERLTTSQTPQSVGSFSPDGRSLVFQEGGTVTSSNSADLMLLRLDSPPRAEPLLRTPFFELAGDLPPDGPWLAYYSNESGRAEVYVRPFPHVNAGLWQISAAGGSRPAWSKDGRELFYLDATTAMMAVPVQTGTTFSPGKPVQLVPGPWYNVQSVRPFDVSRDGKFLMIKNPGHNDPRLVSPTITVVVGWSDELKSRVPAK